MVSIVKAPFHFQQLCGLIDTPPAAKLDRAVKDAVEVSALDADGYQSSSFAGIAAG